MTVSPDIFPEPSDSSTDKTSVTNEFTTTDDQTNQKIFQVLWESLNPLGIRFKFAIQKLTQTPTLPDHLTPQLPIDLPQLTQPLNYRLWVYCYSPKTFDGNIVAPPLTEKLRALKLSGLQDASIRFIVSGQPDWRLRIDLTPNELMLKGWSRWGDVQSIIQLLNLALKSQQIELTAVLKNLSIHLYCRQIIDGKSKVPKKEVVLSSISPLLQSISPQGIQSATIYGVENFSPSFNDSISAKWTYWLDLPASTNPYFTPTPLSLAEQGNEEAITFIIQRFLNPDIEQCFKTGGIGVSILARQGVLHIMTESPICPLQSQISGPVEKVLRQLKIPGIVGARLYGRIAGQITPSWSYGIDFHRQQDGIAADPNYDGSVVDYSTPFDDLSLSKQIQNCLCKIPIFTNQKPIVYHHDRLSRQNRLKIGLLSLSFGIIFAIQTDWLLDYLLSSQRTGELTNNTPTLSPIESLNNPVFDQKLAFYRQLAATNGPPDILIVGSSRALRGISPQELQTELAKKGYPNLRIYNFGINGATAQVVDFQLRQMLKPKELPKLVIWADGSRAFNQGRNDQTYNSLASSPGYQILADNNQSAQEFNPVQAVVKAPITVKSGYTTLDYFLEGIAINLSASYDKKEKFKNFITAQLPTIAIENLANSSSAPVSASDLETIKETVIDPQGFLPLPIKFVPKNYYQKYQKVWGGDDGDYANFSLQGVQDEAFKNTINYLQKYQIPLIFVNVPLTDYYLDGYRQKHEGQFKQYLQTLANQSSVSIVDMVGMWTKNYHLFSDPSHLNVNGGVEVSRYLVHHPQIKWTEKLKNNQQVSGK